MSAGCSDVPSRRRRDSAADRVAAAADEQCLMRLGEADAFEVAGEGADFVAGEWAGRQVVGLLDSDQDGVRHTHGGPRGRR